MARTATGVTDLLAPHMLADPFPTMARLRAHRPVAPVKAPLVRKGGFMATRYHSLVAEPTSLPACLAVTARTADGVILGIAHRARPIYGVQFHPESIETEHGHRLLRNFLGTVESKVAS